MKEKRDEGKQNEGLFIFPQTKVFLGLLVLSVLTLWMSFKVKNVNLQSILSNIFAGLITGLILSLISGTRQLYTAKIESEIKWLTVLHEKCLMFISSERELRASKKTGEEMYNQIYDAIVLSGDIVSLITQSKHNKRLSFDSVEYCNDNFSFDAQKYSEQSLSIKNRIENEGPTTNKEGAKMLEPLYDSIHRLNIDVVNEINELEIRIDKLEKSII